MESIHCIKHVAALVVGLLTSCQELEARLLYGELPLQADIRGADDERLRLA